MVLKNSYSGIMEVIMSLNPTSFQNVGVLGISSSVNLSSTRNSNSNSCIEEKADISGIQDFSSQIPSKSISSLLPKSTGRNTAFVGELSEAPSDGFPNNQTLTKIEFYNRFNTLVPLEEDLDNKGECLSDRQAKELEVLFKLVKKEKN